MNLYVNQLLEWVGLTPPKIERLLWIEPAGNWVVTIEMCSTKALPIWQRMVDILEALVTSKLRILEIDSYAFSALSELEIPVHYRQHRDKAWTIIGNCVSDERVFIPKERGALILAMMAQKGCTKRTIYKYLRQYWQGGQNKNALLPRFDQCGGKAKERQCGEQKRGRPGKLAQITNQHQGVNIDVEMRERFRRGISLFYENATGRTLKDAYQLTLFKFFHQGYELHNQVWVPILPPAEELPTYRQFRYWYFKNQDLSKTLQSRLGQREFNLQHRALLGDSTQMAFGPGSLYQIDATIGDVYLVSSLNRHRIIGRPVIYLVIDVFSRLISGFSVSLEGPSWLGAMLALENATADKVAFCHEFGIEINSADWPSRHCPEAILADRGEFEGYNADNLVNALNIRVANTPPYRPDWKAIVERHFRTCNDKLIRFLPGAVHHKRSRGDRDYRLDAVLDLHQFRKLMILCILDHNQHHRLQGYQMDEFMINDAVEPYPVDLWHWGVRNRVGHLRTSSTDMMRLHLLPSAEATVTPKGIRCHKLLYTCDLALQQQWFVKARVQGSWKVKVAYDPRQLEQIYLRLNNNNQIVTCHLLPCSKTFSGRDWHEAIDYWAEKKLAMAAENSRSLQTTATFHAQVEQLVSEAVQHSELHQSSTSKQSRIQGIRETRRTEREQERSDLAWQLGVTEPQNNSSLSEKTNEEYVPPPQPLDLLRRLREESWNDEP
ncbi:Integrase catalytic region [Crinalium epipsammum PCC 9333]|uniref:Integrase catalytic region n=2 Tax=Crinalium TaxID=241421 RepID=K9VVU0_9CYAN|nr:Mu transposase C-terminal domain-containing protein [Crinalium epipsammum]AFZ11597.1 Integrase catalytic region [Crinalium epipsammum PCC 9333]